MMSNSNQSNSNSSINKNKFNTMKFFLFASSLLVASTNAFSLQMVSTPPHKNPFRIGSKLQYSTTEDVPQVATTPEFDSKVRNLLKPKELKEPKKELDNIKEVNSREALKAAVLEDSDRLTVVRFYAPYCQSCKRTEPQWRQFAKRNPSVQCIQVAYTKERSNRQLVHSLGVPSFPYMHVYNPNAGGLMEEGSLNVKFAKDMFKKVESYVDGGCDLPEMDDEGLYSTPYKSLSS